jgi:hypothetical protein
MADDLERVLRGLEEAKLFLATHKDALEQLLKRPD